MTVKQIANKFIESHNVKDDCVFTSSDEFFDYYVDVAFFHNNNHYKYIHILFVKLINKTEYIDIIKTTDYIPSVMQMIREIDNKIEIR